MIRQVFIQEPLCLPPTEGMGMTRRSVGVPPPYPCLRNLPILSVENMSFRHPLLPPLPGLWDHPRPLLWEPGRTWRAHPPWAPQSAPTTALQSPCGLAGSTLQAWRGGGGELQLPRGPSPFSQPPTSADRLHEYETLAPGPSGALALQVLVIGRGLHDAAALSHREPPAPVTFSRYLRAVVVLSESGGEKGWGLVLRNGSMCQPALEGPRESNWEGGSSRLRHQVWGQTEMTGLHSAFLLRSHALSPPLFKSVLVSQSALTCPENFFPQRIRRSL